MPGAGGAASAEVAGGLADGYRRVDGGDSARGDCAGGGARSAGSSRRSAGVLLVQLSRRAARAQPVVPIGPFVARLRVGGGAVASDGEGPAAVFWWRGAGGHGACG